MIDVKNNFKNKYNDLFCRACRKDEETQTHVLEICPEIHKTDETKVRQRDVFCDEVDDLRKTADKIREVTNKIKQYSLSSHNRT